MQPNFLLLVLVLVIGALGAVLLLAMVRLAAATRRANRNLKDRGDESALVTVALGEAVTKIREQERATHARATASERLSDQIIASLSSGLLVVGVSGEVRILNPVGRRLLGLPTPAEGIMLRDAGGSSVGPLADVVDECLASQHPIVRRTLVLDSQTQPGTVTHLGVSVSPMSDEQEHLQGAICLFADLSAVVDLEDRLRLQESLAEVGELTAGIAHEFRNGLATIHGYSRLLVPERVQTEYRPYVEGIRQETVALREVVDNFLNFARPAQLSVSAVSLERLVNRAAEEIRGELQKPGGDVIVRGTFPDVEGDEVLLRQAISNLCHNAADACLEGDRRPEVVLEGTVDHEHGQTTLTVTDNGPGFEPGQREKIFRPFFTTKSGGIGLGLALTQKIIVTHNGRVTASVSASGGARMDVVLPLQRASQHVQ
jgi:two-component system sensor histidine kinase PilS (NtrC family)